MRLIDADKLPYKTHRWMNPDGQEFSWECVDKYDIDNAPTYEEPDGCCGCKYEDLGEDDMPCKECKNNYTNEWTPMPKWEDAYPFYECPVCKAYIVEKTKYCPHCGTRMG